MTHMQDRHSATPSLSCIIPAYNEAAGLMAVVEEVLATLQALSSRVEVVVVNDGSRDATALVGAELARRHSQVVMLNLSRNFGKEAALSAGLATARGDVVFIMDGDGQHPTALLAPMLAQWREGRDVVYAVRRSRADQSALQARVTNWFYRLINWGSHVEIPAHAGDFRLMDRRVVQALAALPERNRFMKGLYAWVGFDSAAIDYDPLPRRDGVSRFGFGGAFRLALTGMLAFSTVPLRLLTSLGSVLALLALGYGAWVVVDWWIWGITVPGYATIVTALMFFSGVQLIAFGVLSEYVARIYDEVKGRPLYVLKNRLGQGLDTAGQDTPSRGAP